MDGLVMLGRTAGPSIAVMGLWVQFVAGETTAPGIVSLVLVILRVTAMCLGQRAVGHAVLVLAYSVCLMMAPVPGAWVALAGLYVAGVTEYAESLRPRVEAL